MQKEMSCFNKELGSYSFTSLPAFGTFDYILKNDNLLVKVDQFGINYIQLTPPHGIAVFKRERREVISPIRTYFMYQNHLYHNFDVHHADKLNITYTPGKLTYSLIFKDLEVVTELLIAHQAPILFYCLSFISHKKDVELKIMNTSFYYMQEFVMVPWDKPEWYLRSEYHNHQLLVKRLSVNAKKEERHTLSLISSIKNESISLSFEKLISSTKNLTMIPKSLDDASDDVYGYEQSFASLHTLKLKKNKKTTVKCIYAVDNVDIKKYLSDQETNRQLELSNKQFAKLFNFKKVTTKHEDFNQFINGFLPLELSWVIYLDRGWPTKMRGTRDAANDLQAYIDYDPKLCRSVIKDFLSRQRSDGWYPRQIGTIDLNKNDLRDFIDSGCFFFEFVYRYLCYTNDLALLKEKVPYLDNVKQETIFEHLERGINFYMNPKHIGEHGIVKMEGGDWMDTLRGAGIKGIGESVMVSCQLVIVLNEWIEILKHLKINKQQKYIKFVEQLKDNINRCSLNKKGYYNAVYTDERKWLFSTNDYDGKERIYIPTNAYAILSGVADNPQRVINNIEKNETPIGYALFNHPLGEKYLANIGKMGTGDFAPCLLENGSVYNHGSQCFYLLAIAKLKDYELFNKVLNYVLPYKRDESQTGAASYTITNCYQLIPSMYGRSAFAFLTGSVSMLEIIIYQAMLGIKYDLNHLIIDPCLPKTYQDAKVEFTYLGKKITIQYEGYGKLAKPILIKKDKIKNNSKLIVKLS